MKELEINKVYHMDCLDGMKLIKDKSIDMILCDLPYGTTKCKWDIIIPFKPLWEQYERIIKDNGAIILFGSQPFTSLLINSNIKLFKYEIIWDKVKPSSGLLAKKQPLKSHENICIFYKKQPTYNPQMEIGTQWHRGGNKRKSAFTGETEIYDKAKSDETNLKYPKSIKTISNADNTKRLHPTQKPIELIEWLIKTYSNEGDLILDNCMGSGTTAIACINTNRNYIGFEKEKEYIDMIENRIAEHIG